jgi:hypothetical protein
VAKHCFIIMPFSETSERHTEAYGATFFTEFLTVFTDLSTRAEGPGIERDPETEWGGPSPI